MMQGRQDIVDTFPETVNIDQGSLPNNTDVNQPSSLNNILNPVETWRSSYTVASGGSINGITHDAQSYGIWNSGETSSRAQSMFDNGVKMDRGQSSYGVHVGGGSELEERRIQETDILFPGRLNGVQGGNQLRHQPILLQGSSSSNSGQNENPNESYISRRGSYGPILGPSIDPNFYRLGGAERDHASNVEAFSDNAGSSSRSSSCMLVEDDDVSGPSVGNWGLSCKRKALEGASGQSYSGGSSSSFQPNENGAWHSGPTNNHASSSLSLSTPTQNCPSSTPDHLNLGVGVGVRAANDSTPSSSTRTDLDNRNESLPFSLRSSVVSRGSTLGTMNESRRLAPFNDSSRQLAAAAAATSSSPINRPSTIHVSSMPRNLYPLPWNGYSNLTAANMSSSLNAGERGVVSRDEVNRRIAPRHNPEHTMFVPASDVRNVEQDPIGWTLASGNINSSGSVSSSIRAGSSSSIHSLPIPSWAPHNPSAQNQQRQSEFASWSLFPSIDFESVAHSDNFPQFSSAPSSQEAIASSSSNNHDNTQPHRRSAFLLDRQGDDVPGMPRSLRALAADIEGRHRLISEIRQVLNAMRRGESIRLEDYMPFDPFPFHGMAELHDRHRDMRLDVDNMSYEELLALEERIGDVSTGLSEESITELMKKQKYASAAAESAQDVEPCCICQEEYADGDDLGRLNCRHDFHADCIKQWLMQKNLCPICKETALSK